MNAYVLRLLHLILLLSVSSIAFAQLKPHLDLIKSNAGPPHQAEDLKITPFQPAVPTKTKPFNGQRHTYQPLPKLVAPQKNSNTLQVVYAGRSGPPAAIYGESDTAALEADPERKVFTHLAAVKAYLQIDNPDAEFRIIADREGRNGYRHIKLQQFYREVPVYGGELMVHLKDGHIHMVNGRPFATPAVKRLTPGITLEQAAKRALEQVNNISEGTGLSTEQRKILGLEESKAELILYHPPGQEEEARLVWRVEVVPDIYHREAYFLDAHTGAVLFHQDLLCKAHGLPPTGPAAGFGRDLLGITRTVNSYEINGTFALIDVSRNMFNSSIPFNPGNPAGAIWTLDAKNTSPSGNFSAEQVLSTNVNIWSDAAAVSAHYNAGVAYEYFRTTFNRNSINGRGGTVISYVNVAEADGSGLDNAFWTGNAILYGNGDNVFLPMARSLDVAGHEMSHGVIQTTANLEYLSQSGALNESFADIFGAMIDRNDWQLGEDVVKPGVFPSGALRDLSNPNNGGTGFGALGWQPAHMNEYVNLPETKEGDNGGVHVNSGIVNRAFFLFASAVGKDVAEQVYYNALVNYLSRYSQFTDMRTAAVESANELYSTNVANAAANAFAQVGITGGGGGNQPVELEPNPGQEIVLLANTNKQSLHLYTYENGPIASPFIIGDILSKPSASDDGSLVVFVNGQQNIQLLEIDWLTGLFNSFDLTDNGIWRNASISKDGRLLTALTNDFDNQLYVFRLDTGVGRAFTLSNPTTAQGISTADVAYADVTEWSYDGEFIMYDVLSTTPGPFGPIQFWDIGFLRAWDSQADDFGDGYISKLFTGLSANLSIGNPSFAKNSPFTIALDLFDAFSQTFTIIGVDVLNGDVGFIYSNLDVGFPSYSIQDDELVFDAFDTFGNRVLGKIGLAEDKINSIGNAFILIAGDSGARWGTVFANGERDLNPGGEEGCSPIGSTSSVPCQEINLVLDNNTLTSGVYKASSELVSASTIGQGSCVIFGAQNRIRLLPGFRVAPDAYFTGRIEPCGLGLITPEEIEPTTTNSWQLAAVNPPQATDRKTKAVTLFNQPNPFSNETEIVFELPEAGTARLSIFDFTGKTIKHFEGQFPAGYNTVTFQAGDIPQGLYQVFLSVDGKNAHHTMVLTK